MQKVAAAQAREGKARKKNLFNSGGVEISPIASSETGSPAEDLEMESESDVECTGWTGGISHPFKLSDSEDDSVWLDSDTDVDSDEDFDLEELEGQDLVEGLKKYWEQELQLLTQQTPYELLLQKKTSRDWKTAEAKRGFGYNGLSDRRKREVNQKLREKEERDKVIRER